MTEKKLIQIKKLFQNKKKSQKPHQNKNKWEAVFNINNCTWGEKVALTKVLQKRDLHADAACLTLSIRRWAVHLQRGFLSEVSLSSHLENCFPLLSCTREQQHSKFITEDFSHFWVSPHNCSHSSLFSGLLDHPCAVFNQMIALKYGYWTAQ